MSQMVLGLNKEVEFKYNGTPRKGVVDKLVPQHDMVLVIVGHDENGKPVYRNFKISKMEW